MPWSEAKLHVLSHGPHYGGAVFEGERASHDVISESRQHSERFKRSAESLDFEIPSSVAELDAAKAAVIARNGVKDAQGVISPLAPQRE